MLANDDGLPSGDCFAAYKWRLLNGPSSLILEDDTTLDSRMTFAESGKYVLEIMADDGLLQGRDTVVVYVFDHFSTTLDHDQDNVPSGMGADANLRGWSNFLKNYGGSNSFGPRHYNQFPAKSILRIDVSAFSQNQIEEAMFEIEVATTNTGVIEDWEYNVFGLMDGHSGEDWIEGNLDGVESMNGEINYDNAPEFSNSTGGFFDPNINSSGGVNHDSTVFIGIISTRKGRREKIHISSTALADFINADEDGIVTFLMTRKTFALNTVVFASKEHATFSPPTLYLADCKGGNIYVDQQATGTGRGDSWENAFVNLDNALANRCAGSNDTIKMAEGNYFPSTDSRFDSFLLPNGLVIQGGYSSGGQVFDPSIYQVILDGNIGAIDATNDNLFQVVNILNGTTVSLNDLIISGGNADGIGDFSKGAGVFCRGELWLHNVQILDNVSQGDGQSLFITPTGEVMIGDSCVVR